VTNPIIGIAFKRDLRILSWTSGGTIQGLSLSAVTWIRDDGWSRFSGTYRILVRMRYRVPGERENRRTKRTEIFARFQRRSAFLKRSDFKVSEL
jgi:hypothetical protein